MTIRITIDQLAIEAGVGKRTAIRLVRDGKLPGFMDGRTYICSPGEFNKWQDGEWTYTGVPSTPVKPIAKPTFLHTVNSKGIAS